MLSGRDRSLRLAALVMAQMLPATIITPAIRPLFAALHGGAEGPMHAFMSVNMLAAAVAAPAVGMWLDRRDQRRRWLMLLAALDAVLLVLCTQPLSTSLVLGLRFAEGAAHVGAATLLLTEAANIARRERDTHIMGAVGAGIIVAVACGNMLGAWLVGFDLRAPFLAGAACAMLVAAVGPALLSEEVERTPTASCASVRSVFRLLAVPVSAAFVSRFTIGCLVVTFSLFAHHGHGLTDRTIGGLFASMTVPFALATYPAARLAQRVPASLVLAGGVLCYALVLLSLGYVETGTLGPLMALGGVASACIFAPTLGYVAQLTPSDAKARGMALFNGAGCLGMLLGPTFAGILSAIVRSSQDPLHAYRVVFACAGLSLILWLGASARWLFGELRLETAREGEQVVPAGPA